jgi:hypothetical protein
VQIRTAQFERFEEEGTRRFENELVEHLKTFANRHCKVIGDEGVRQVIRLGFESSKRYGFSMQGPMRFFIELMFMFGGYFDTDVQHPWAAEALADPLVEGELFRADALHQKMEDYLRVVSGPENAFAKSALRETRRLAAAPPPTSTNDLRDELMARMEKVYPEKCAWLGESRLGAVIDGGIGVATIQGVTSTTGLSLFAVLAFALGHRFADDPLFPWIAATLNHTTMTDPNTRAERLQEKALLYLDRVLAYLEKN